LAELAHNWHTGLVQGGEYFTRLVRDGVLKRWYFIADKSKLELIAAIHLADCLKYVNSDALNVIFLTLALLSILISIILYFRSRKDRRPVYDQKSFNLIRDQTSKVKGLRITHNGEEVRDLTLTKVALWNRGRETINRGDVAPSDALRLTAMPEYRIIQAEVTYAKTKANNFSLKLADDRLTVLIDFDYFHTNEGVMIDIYHTGSSNEHIKLEGTIKGVAQILRGGAEKDVLFRRFADATIGKMMPRGKDFKLRHLWILIPFTLVSMPIVVPIMIVDSVRNFIKKVPKDFTVQ
jgi:hypothetical protein